MTLTDFLLARIAEDEAAAHDWPIDGKWGLHSPGLMWMDARGRPIYAPRARVLAECEAKRRIVGMAGEAYARMNSGDYGDVAALIGRGGALSEVLQSLALPFADHPDYRDEWKP